MDNQLTSILNQVKSLAEKRGWEQVTAMTNAISTAPNRPTTLVVDTGVAIEGLRNWLDAVGLPAYQVITTGELSADPLRALTADKVIGVFECGKLVEPEIIPLLDRAFFARPQGSYAMVIANCEKILNQDDLETVEGIAWGALVPGRKERWERNNLQAQNVYLWGSPGETAWITDRLGKDGSALLTWLKLLIQEQELEQYQVRSLIETALEANGRAEQAGQDGGLPVDPTKPIRDALNSIVDLNRRLSKRLSSSADIVERELLTSLDALENRLKKSIRAYAEKQPVGYRPGDEEPWLQDLVAQDLHRWERESADRLTAYGHEAVNDAKALFNVVDWEMINRLIDRLNVPERYPDCLVGSLAGEISRTGGLAIMEANRRASATGKRAESGEQLDILIRYAIGIGVAATVATLLAPPLGAIGGAVGGTLGIAGIEAYQKRQRRSSRVKLLESRGNAYVQELVQQAREQIHTRVRQNLNAAEQHFSADFNMLEDRLNQVIGMETQNMTGNIPARDRQQLQMFWQQVTTL